MERKYILRKTAGYPMFFFLCFICLTSALLASPTLQERIDAAKDGATIDVEPGVYRENIRITKPIHLIGKPGVVLEGNAKGNVVHIEAPNVLIEGLEIRRSGTDLSEDQAGIKVEGDYAVIRNNTLRDVLHGVYVKGASHTTIVNNNIRGWKMDVEETTDPGNTALCSVSSDRRGNGIHFWNSSQNEIRNNTIDNTRDGIYLSFTNKSLIKNNHVIQCRYGLHYMYSDENHIIGNYFAENAAGAALMFSKQLLVEQNTFTENRGQRASGVILHSVDYSKFDANHITHNRAGLYLQNCNGNTILTNQLEKNYLGLRLTGSSTNNFFQENRSRGNLHNVDLTGHDNHNRWDDGKRGNYWSDSLSIDLDGDGVGEWPHHEVDILGQSRHDFSLVALLSASPFLQAVQFAFQRTPVPGFPAIRDNHPLQQEP